MLKHIQAKTTGNSKRGNTMKIIFWCTISLRVQRVSCTGCRGNCCIINPNADEDSHPSSKTDAPLRFINLVSNHTKARDWLSLPSNWNWNITTVCSKGIRSVQQLQGQGCDYNWRPDDWPGCSKAQQDCRRPGDLCFQTASSTERQTDKQHYHHHQQKPKKVAETDQDFRCQELPMSFPFSSSPPSPLPQQKAC